MSGKSQNKLSSGLRRIILITWPYLLALLIFILVRLAIGNELMVEKYYHEALYPAIAGFLSGISKLAPFSLWDLFWITAVILFLTGLVLVIFRRIKPGRYFLRVTQLIALLYTLFYLTWGFNYFRPGIATRLEWGTPELKEQDFRSLLDTLIVATNKSFTEVSVSEYKVIDSLIEVSYQRNSSGLGIKYSTGMRKPKKMLFSSYFAKSGINGYFGPFFNEVHLNSYLLPADYPFSLAHEKAHQFGICSEAEANLTAFIICSTSESRKLNFSGNLFLLLYFLNDATNLSDYKEYILKIDKPVIDYIRSRGRYYDGLQNKTLEKVQSAANNIYLKSNNIKSGIKNYNQVVALAISWYNNSLN